MTRMTKRIAISAASMLIAAAMIQTATAAERSKKNQTVPTTSEQVRNANAYAAPYYVDTDELARLRNGAGSAPAGR